MDDVTSGTLAELELGKSSYVFPNVRKIMTVEVESNDKEMKCIACENMEGCCPVGFMCLTNSVTKAEGGIKAELKPNVCAQVDSLKKNAKVRLTSMQILNCVLLTGLLDRVPRFVEPISSKKSSASNVVSNFSPVHDFFRFKLIDSVGLLAFCGLGVFILLLIMDFFSSFMPNRAFRVSSNPHDSLFSISCSALFGCTSPFGNGYSHVDAHFYFTSLRLSLFSLLLCIPALFALFGSTFNVENYYSLLIENNCFSEDLFKETSSVLSSYISTFRRMKICLIVLLVFVVLRCLLLFLICRFHTLIWKWKENVAKVYSDDFEDEEPEDAGELEIKPVAGALTIYDTDGEDLEDFNEKSFTKSLMNGNLKPNIDKGSINRPGDINSVVNHREISLDNVNYRVETIEVRKFNR